MDTLLVTKSSDMKTFQQLAEVPPPVLYHYTSIEGILGILSSGELWATKISYLNDRKEFKHAIDLGREYLQSMVVDSEGIEEVRDELVESLETIESMNICISSFTEKKDLLSQWRGYSGNSVGFSVGFTTADMQRLLSVHGFFLRRCIYDEQIQKNIIKTFFDKRLREVIEPGNEETSSLIAEFVRIAALMKDAGFSEEEEWRIISEPISCLNPRFKYKHSNSVIIPYFSLPIKEEGRKLKIKSIVCGPNQNEILNKDAVRLLALSNGYKSTEIEVSKIPYRKF